MCRALLRVEGDLPSAAGQWLWGALVQSAVKAMPSLPSAMIASVT